MIRSRVIGTGSYLPVRVVPNDAIAPTLNLSPARIQRLTGIRTRHWAGEREASSDMAIEASRLALDAADCSPSSIEAIILSTTSPDMTFPSTACLVQRGLGCKQVGAFDVSASCSGFLYGLSMAQAMIQSGQVRTCLVVASEVKSRSLDPQDETTALLFGDGAGAVILRGEEESTPEWRGILGIRLYADGAHHGLIRLPGGGSRLPLSSDTLRKGEHSLRMRGASLFRIAVRRIEQAVLEILKEFGASPGDLKQIVLHQANGRILSQVAERLGIEQSRLASVIERYGNTSSASLPIALDDAVRGGNISPNDLVLLGTFGGGVTWATGLLRW
ncbi:3-oxoacyl-ACP synthase III family protein [Candidatus Nitrospira nitrificans]|uniref:3-oxoacyl-(Acyl-carrier-protein) synthase 3 n=1 Tax=Candidatus Nitrospira nitrificans TaxID=1742973 RepID=A0A0S4LGA4_9BACT|nr:beta-ketoacyl-ACP synthase III [Candidatus Nitrospira nitrificans]CUS36271.1 3-oxoacyl-(acyl-carrier-protein) synthase 3 [Candidatus Nitrospira nitrificans]